MYFASGKDTGCHGREATMRAGSGRENRPIESKIRAKRVSVGTGVTAETRTIGAPLAFLLTLENVSQTGLLLSASGKGRIPYQINTLIELTLDPNASRIGRPIHLLGRVVRTASAQAEEAGRQFGVQIVQIDSRDNAHWDRFVGLFEPPAA